MAPALEGPVESKRIASGALIAREIHSVAILCEGQYGFAVIDDHRAWVDNATCRQPMQTCPKGKGEYWGLKLGLP